MITIPEFQGTDAVSRANFNSKIQNINSNFTEVEFKKADKTTTYTKSETDLTRTYTLTHTKSGAVHTLTGLPTEVGIYQCQFIATADYAEGDTFSDGYTAKPNGEETTLADKAFITGDLVSVIADTESKKLGFKLGGGTYGTLSPQIKNFTAKAGNHQITLSWTNPSDSNFAGLYLVRKQGSMPTKLSDGIKIDVEMATTYTDNEPENDKLYYYRAFTYNAKKQVQTELTGAVVSATPNSLGNRLFFTNRSSPFEICEFDYTTLNTVRQVLSTTGSGLEGIGGISERLYMCDSNRNKSYELNIETLTPINTANSPGTLPSDIGGTYDRLFHCDRGSDKIYELDANTLTPTKTVNSLSNTPWGIGGTSNRLYYLDYNSSTVSIFHELDLETLTPINTVNAPSSKYKGIGGDRLSLFTSSPSGEIVELNVDTLTPIRFMSKSLLVIGGVGGTK